MVKILQFISFAKSSIVAREAHSVSVARYCEDKDLPIQISKAFGIISVSSLEKLEHASDRNTSAVYVVSVQCIPTLLPFLDLEYQE